MTATSWYRRSVWNYKGNREYTRSGYEIAKDRFVEEDLDVDCTDRQYMITGSNSGIGLQVALEIAKRGGVIHMVCRDEERAKIARSEIITTTGNDKIHLHIVDLAKPREVVLWVERFAAQHDHLHVLVNNAGCMLHERILDEDGVEANFAVNTLAVHIITTTLIPLLQKSEDGRVITVSSAGMLNVRLDPHDLMHLNMEPWIGTLVYSQNKRQQVVMTLWYAQRYDKVHFSSMHPGWADTAAVRTSIPQFYETMKDNLRTATQGADTVVWLAIAKVALRNPSGLFFQDREPVSTHLPLAWTKSSIDEEDLLMKNIQELYIKVHERAYKPPTQQLPQIPEADSVETEPPSIPLSSEIRTPPPKLQESEPELEIVKIPPPPEPRRDEPPATQVSEPEKDEPQTIQDSEPPTQDSKPQKDEPLATQASEPPPANEQSVSGDKEVEETVAAQPMEPPTGPSHSEVKVEKTVAKQPEIKGEDTVTAQPQETKVEAAESNPSPSVDNYVTPEKPKVEDIAGTHNTAPPMTGTTALETAGTSETPVVGSSETPAPTTSPDIPATEEPDDSEKLASEPTSQAFTDSQKEGSEE